MRNISLNSINTFVIAADFLSFKKAAEQLHVTPGAISRQIRGLELLLGGPLFYRQHREVQLTAAGQEYLALVKPALTNIASANQQLINRAQQAVLKIQTSPTFALHWLIPRLASFKLQFPEIQIEIATSSYSIEPDPAFNLYIRRDPRQFSGLKKWPFLIEYCQLVCTHKVLQGHSNLKELLLATPLISYKTRPDLWQLWLDETHEEGLNDLNLNTANKGQNIRFENTIFAIQAAVEGLGIALIPQVFLTDFLHSNTLIAPFETKPIATGHYHLLTQSKQMDHTQLLFLEWLQKEGFNTTVKPS